jgi:hypothetical protein
MTKAQREAEEQARQDELEGRVEALIAAGAMSWVWPGSGEKSDAPSSEGGTTLPRNCFFTGLPVPMKQHPNAHKTLWTQLPGCANKRHQKRQRAGMQRSGAKGPA